MKSFVSYSRKLMILILSLTPYFLNAQNEPFCFTVGGGPGAVGILPTTVDPNSSSSSTGPYYIKVYIHVIRKPDGSGGLTQQDVIESFDRLNSDFNPHNIFFIRDCEVFDVIVEEDDYFDFGIYCDLFGNPILEHDDGIDIFIGSDEITNNAGGIADNIPSTKFWVGGIWNVAVPQPIPARISSIISHEMGHCLGLWHTHHGTVPEGGEDCEGNSLIDPDECCEFVNGSNSDICGDYVEDTDADPRYWASFGIPDPCVNLNLYYFENLNCIEYVSPNVTADLNGDIYTPPTSNTMCYNQRLNCITGFTVGQGERMRQMISSSAVLQACLVEPDFQSLNITTSTTWTSNNTPNNGNILIEGDLVIESGAVLTINDDVTVGFEEDGQLIIEQGARLNLQGTLTSKGCGFSWQGVQVWGNTNEPQNNLHQGYMASYSGSKIENAVIAIKNSGNAVSNQGGMIYCYGTEFLNNRQGIVFEEYAYQNKNYLSNFSDCTFRINNDYSNAHPFKNFIQLSGINGLSIVRCHFRNEMAVASANGIWDWGVGIQAYNASFEVVDNGFSPSSGPTLSSTVFFNLGYGISAHRAFSQKPIRNKSYKVYNSTFDNCFVGIRNNGVSGAEIVSNEFKLGTLPDNNLNNLVQTGIIFNYLANGFECQQNSFVNGSGTSDYQTVGVFCNNTSDFSKEIRKNTFNKLTVGNLANGTNGAQEIPRGLTYLCNSNINVQTGGADFDVATGLVNPIQNIILVSNEIASAGNSFSFTATDFNNSGNGGLDYYYSTVPEEPITIFGVSKIPTLNTNPCQNEFCDPPCEFSKLIGDVKVEFYSVKNDYDNLLANYGNLSQAQFSSLVNYRQKLDDLSYQVVEYIMQDTTNFDQDSLYTWIANMDNLAAQLWLSNEKISAGTYTEALSILDQIPLNFSLTPEESQDVANFRELTELLINKDMYALDANTLSALLQYDEVGGQTEGWARNILTYYGYYYPEEYIFSNNAEERSNNDLDHQDSTEDQFLSVFPNPAREFVIFSTNTMNSEETYNLEIKSIDGQMISNFRNLDFTTPLEWEIGDTPAGIYFYQLISNGSLLDSGKIILIK